MCGWIDAADADAMADGGRRLVRAHGVDIALFRVRGAFHAIEDRCPHQGASLVVGKLDGASVTCPAHGLRFDLASGCMRGNAGLAVRTFAVRVREGRVEVGVGVEPSDLA